MHIPRLWIHFKPRLYQDLLQRVFGTIWDVEVIEGLELRGLQDSSRNGNRSTVDVVILPLDDQGRPDLELLPVQLSEAKLVALSPRGDFGMRRRPGENRWEELHPFGMDELVQEVLEP